jgi:hypothetical protein
MLYLTLYLTEVVSEKTALSTPAAKAATPAADQEGYVVAWWERFDTDHSME